MAYVRFLRSFSLVKEWKHKSKHRTRKIGITFCETTETHQPRFSLERRYLQKDGASRFHCHLRTERKEKQSRVIPTDKSSVPSHTLVYKGFKHEHWSIA